MESIHQTFDYGDFNIGFAYVGKGDDDGEPAMWLKSKRFRAPAYVLPLSDAHRLAEDGDLIKCAVRACNVTRLAFGGADMKSKRVIYKVARALNECVTELIRMPPQPPKNTLQLIEDAVKNYGLALKADGKTVIGD